MKKMIPLVLAACALIVCTPPSAVLAKPFPIYDYLQKIENTDWIVAETLRWTPESGANLKGYYVFYRGDEDRATVTILRIFYAGRDIENII